MKVQKEEEKGRNDDSLMASNVAKKTDTGERVGSPQIVKNEK